jgi:membrane protease YdiL (CAAX protease family)
MQHMKRLLMGLVWFVLLAIIPLIVGTTIAGAIAGSGSSTFEEGARAGELAGSAFAQRYGLLLVLTGLLVAVVGSIAGVLPGTKKRATADTAVPEGDDVYQLATDSSEVSIATDAREARPPLRAARALLIFALHLLAQLVTGVFVGLGIAAWYAASGGELESPAFQAYVNRVGSSAGPLVGAIVSGIVVIAMTRAFAHGKIRECSADGIAWSRGILGHLISGFLVGCCMSIAYLYVASVLIPPSPEMPKGTLVHMAQTPGWPRICWVILALAIAPPLEEFLYRGVLFSGITRSWGKPIAVVIVTVLFVASHAFEAEVRHYWPAAVSITLLALGALVFRMRTHTLGPAIAIHFGYNTVIVLAVYIASS